MASMQEEAVLAAHTRESKHPEAQPARQGRGSGLRVSSGSALSGKESEVPSTLDFCCCGCFVISIAKKITKQYIVTNQIRGEIES